jgi:hypothetical protein
VLATMRDKLTLAPAARLRDRAFEGEAVMIFHVQTDPDATVVADAVMHASSVSERSPARRYPSALIGKDGNSGVGAILFGLMLQTEGIRGARQPLSPVVADFEAAS